MQRKSVFGSLLFSRRDVSKGDVGPMKIHSGTPRSRSVRCSLWLIFICALMAPAQSEARTRSICGLFPRPCGMDDEITCDSSPSCDAGFASFAFDSFDPIRCAPIPFTFFDFLSDFCYDCCEAGKLAGAGGCNSGLTHSRPQNLVGGTIAPCSHLLPADAATTNFQIDILGLPIATYSFNPPSSVDLVNARGVCSRGNPVRFSGASREVWPASSSLSSERSTIFVIHGRGGSCAGFDELLTDAIYDRNQLTYCVEYDAQTVVGEDPPRSTPGPAGRAVKIIPVLQDQTGEGPSTCPGTPSSCSFSIRVLPG